MKAELIDSQLGRNRYSIFTFTILVSLTLASAAIAKKGGRYLIKTRNTVNIEGSDKPALIAEQLILAMS